MFNVVDSMVAEFGLDHRKFTAGTKAMSAQTIALSKTLKGAGTALAAVQAKARAVYAPLSKVSVLMGGLTGAVIVRNIVKTGASFERMMTVVKGVSGATEKMFNQMSKAARHYGETTEWTATQAAESLKYLSMAGLSADQALAALPSTLDLATAGQIDLGRAADIATNIMTQMQLEVEDLTRVNDALVTVQATSNTTINEAAEAWIYAGTKARAFGVEVEELGAMIGILADAGIKSTMAGTTLRQSMIKLLSPTKEASDILDKHNFSVRTATGGIKSFTDVVMELADKQLDIIEITEIFGARAGNIQVILDKGSDALREYIGEIKGAEGASKRLADLFREDMVGLWHQLKSAVEGVSQELYMEFRPNLEKLLKDATKWIRDNKNEIREWGKETRNILGGVTDFVKNHPDIIKYGLVGLIFRGKLGLTIAAVGITRDMTRTYLKDPIEDFLNWLEGIGWESEKAWGKVYKPPTPETEAILNEAKLLAKGLIKQDKEIIAQYWKDVEKLGKHMADVANRAANSRRTAIVEALMDEKKANEKHYKILGKISKIWSEQEMDNLEEINEAWTEFYHDKAKEAKKSADKILKYELWLLDQQTDALEDFYTTDKKVNEKKIEDHKNYSETMKDLYKDLGQDMQEASKQSVNQIVSDFIAGENLKTSVARVSANFISDAAGRAAGDAYNKAIEKIIALIGALLGQGAAGSGAQGAMKGGVTGALLEIGLFLGTGVVSMLAGKALANKFRAGGGWIGEHPSGGTIQTGSGLKDDVFLGTTPGVRHWGMGGEFVVNKKSTARYRDILEAINDRRYASGDYVDYEGTQIPWHPTADALIMGAGMSFLHGCYKGAGPISGLIEAGVFLASAIPSMFAGKLMADKFSSEGNYIDVGHGLGSFLGDIISKPSEWVADVLDPVADLISNIPFIGDIVADDIRAAAHYLDRRGEWAKEWMDPSTAWERILELIRTPLEGVARDLVTPNKYYSNPLDSISIMLDFLKDQLDPERELLEELFPFGKGTPFVPYTGPAMVHEGERIFSVNDNKSLIAAINDMGSREPTNVNFHLHGIVTTDDVDKWASDRMEAVKQKTIGTQYKTEELWAVGINMS